MGAQYTNCVTAGNREGAPMAHGRNRVAPPSTGGPILDSVAHRAIGHHVLKAPRHIPTTTSRHFLFLSSRALLADPQTWRNVAWEPYAPMSTSQKDDWEQWEEHPSQATQDRPCLALLVPSSPPFSLPLALPPSPRRAEVGCSTPAVSCAAQRTYAERAALALAL